MKRILILLLAMMAVHTAFSQYKPADQGSSLKFTIKNLGFDVDGTFTGFKGTINFDSQNPAKDNFDITIDAASVNTDNTLRDSHLRDDSYFNVKSFPVIRFISTKIAPSGNGAYTISGKLTIKDKSQDISFPFTAAPSGDDYLFKGSFKINRKDFGVGGTSTISNQLEVFLSVLAKKA